MRIDFAALINYLHSQAIYILPGWIPGGKFEGHEYLSSGIRGGPGDSFRYNFEKRTGCDFATGETFGDMVNLYARIEGLGMADAARKIMETLALNSEIFTEGSAPTPPPEPAKKKTISNIGKPPAGIEKPNFKHFKHGLPTMKWLYRDLDGAPLFFIVRYDTETGKQFSPFSWDLDQNDWVQKAYPDPRPMYGLEQLNPNPDLRVMIVEGEKAADAARKICGKNYLVMSWPGGANSWQKVDWSPLAGRKVLIWPDRDFQKNKSKTEVLPYPDQPGTKAAAGIAEKLYNLCPEIKVLDVSDVTAEGFDAADAVEEGWDTNRFLAWARERVRIVKDESKPSVTQPPPEPEKPRVPDIIEPPMDEPPLGFDDVPMPTIADSPELSNSMMSLLPDRNASGKPLSTLENLRTLIGLKNITIRYNVIKKQEEILIPGKSYSIDNGQNASLSYVVSEAAKLQIPLGQVQEYVSYIADENQYNPVATWITSKPWDGKSRLQDLYDTVKTDDKRLKEILMYRWLISAVAAAFEPNGVVARGVLVFQAPQYLGKTMWFKRLVPANLEVIADGMLLRPDDKDSVKQIVSYWMVELGELDATFKRSDIAQLKAFISKQRDKLRAAYARKESEFARRTVFFGSVNPEQFLADETGNTRYWTVRCEDINHRHDIDIQQLWAEVYEEHYKKGVTWFLTHEEMLMLNDSNETFSAQDAVEESVLHELDWKNPMAIWSWKTSSEILKMLDFKHFGKSEVSKCANVVRKKNGKSKERYKREGGVYYHYVPGRVPNLGDYREPPPFLPQRKNPGD